MQSHVTLHVISTSEGVETYSARVDTMNVRIVLFECRSVT